jgi:hemerythrin-like metal-binding protein
MGQPVLAVDLELIDRDHRILRDLIERLQDALTEGCAEDEIASRQAALNSHLDAHMEFEEKLMVERQYPLAFTHAREHKAFRDQVTAVLDGLAKQVVSRANVAKLLIRIHDHHIKYSDQTFCLYLTDKYSLQAVADGAGI